MSPVQTTVQVHVSIYGVSWNEMSDLDLRGSIYIVFLINKPVTPLYSVLCWKIPLSLTNYHADFIQKDKSPNAPLAPTHWHTLPSNLFQTSTDGMWKQRRGGATTPTPVPASSSAGSHCCISLSKGTERRLGGSLNEFQTISGIEIYWRKRRRANQPASEPACRPGPACATLIVQSVGSICYWAAPLAWQQRAGSITSIAWWLRRERRGSACRFAIRRGVGVGGGRGESQALIMQVWQ